ncbi:MAG: endonuclease/exonuclease/phosphatase family protein [Pseudomonadales bacterium]
MNHLYKIAIQLMFTPFLAMANPAYADESEELNGVLLMTLNVAHARATGVSQLLQSSNTARSNLLAIADTIIREQADIVAFQEIDKDSFWNGKFNHGQYLADKTKLDSFYIGSHQRGIQLDYGTGLMSRYQLTDSKSTTFEKPFARPSKGFVISTIKWPEDDSPEKREIEVDLVSLHLDFLSHEERHSELDTLTKFLASRNNLRIIMGDFNMEYKEQHDLIPEIASKLGLHTWLPDEDDLVTYQRTGKRLDWVLVSTAFEIIEHRVLDDALSDHQAVLVKVSLLK